MSQFGRMLGGYPKATIAGWEYGKSPVPQAVSKLIKILLVTMEQ